MRTTTTTASKQSLNHFARRSPAPRSISRKGSSRGRCSGWPRTARTPKWRRSPGRPRTTIVARARAPAACGGRSSTSSRLARTGWRARGRRRSRASPALRHKGKNNGITRLPRGRKSGFRRKFLKILFQTFFKTFSRVNFSEWHSQVRYRLYNSRHDESKTMSLIKSNTTKYFRNVYQKIKSMENYFLFSY